jgi:hypothetical protein
MYYDFSHTKKNTVLLKPVYIKPEWRRVNFPLLGAQQKAGGAGGGVKAGMPWR